jgi:hypothetical protein
MAAPVLQNLHTETVAVIGLWHIVVILAMIQILF